MEKQQLNRVGGPKGHAVLLLALTHSCSAAFPSAGIPLYSCLELLRFLREKHLEFFVTLRRLRFLLGWSIFRVHWSCIGTNQN